jgi:putative ABC transport system permease protein
MFQDLVHACRAFWRTRTLSVTIVLTLALGLGGTTAMFAIADRLVLNPLPFHDSDRLVFLWRANAASAGGGISTVSAREVSAWRGMRSMEAVEPFAVARVDFTGAGDPVTLTGRSISHGLLEMLGVRPALGRDFDRNDAVAGAPPTVILSDELWRRVLGADPAVLGKAITLDGKPHVVIGVMPAGFALPIGGEHEFWLPQTEPSADLKVPRHFVIGKLTPGATLATAQSELDGVSAGLAQEDPALKGWGGRILDVAETIGEDKQRLAMFLFAASAMILLIAMFNAAQLLLARAVAHEREYAIRQALGAGRGRLLRQLLMDGLVLGAACAAAGVVWSGWIIRVLAALQPPNLSELARVHIDTRSTLFGIVVALMVSVVGALTPWIRIRAWSAASALARGSNRTSTRDTHRARGVLSAVQIAFCLMVLVATTLLLRSFGRLMNTDIGISPEGLAVVSTSLPPDRYQDRAARLEFIRTTLDEIRAIPGVEAAEIATAIPPRMSVQFGQIQPGDRTLSDAEAAVFYTGGPVGPAFFQTTGIRLLEGRIFTDADRAGSEPVMIVNRSTTRFYWRGQSALGKRLTVNGTSRTIVGIVNDVRGNDIGGPIVPLQMYFPFAQASQGPLAFVVRTDRQPASISGDVKALLLRRDSRLVVRATTASAMVRETVARERFTLTLLATYAGLALTMSAVGIGGLIAFAVVQRTREIGIRAALGATPRQAVTTVARQSLIPCLAGLLAGALASFGVARLMKSLLYESQGLETVALIASAALLIAVAALASYIPARRAARVSPLVALQMD